jgi:hypothetical protein
VKHLQPGEPAKADRWGRGSTRLLALFPKSASGAAIRAPGPPFRSGSQFRRREKTGAPHVDAACPQTGLAARGGDIVALHAQVHD